MGYNACMKKSINPVSFFADMGISFLRSAGLPLAANGIECVQIGRNIRMKYRKNSMDSVVIAENMIIRLYDRFLPDINKNDWIIDIGGHIGTTTVHLAKRFPETNILTIEPYPDSYALLEQNLLLNDISSPPVFISNVAVANDKNGRILHIDKNNTGGNSMIRTRDALHQTRVPSMPLSDLFTRYNIQQAKFVKIDCEGAEYEILLSLPNTLLQRIHCIIIEYTLGGPISEVVHKLKINGFTTKITSGFTDPLLKHITSIPLCYAYR